jgi:hypothetical protein
MNGFEEWWKTVNLGLYPSSDYIAKSAYTAGRNQGLKEAYDISFHHDDNDELSTSQQIRQLMEKDDG